jgi:hypothetical protein
MGVVRKQAVLWGRHPHAWAPAGRAVPAQLLVSCMPARSPHTSGSSAIAAAAVLGQRDAPCVAPPAAGNGVGWCAFVGTTGRACMHAFPHPQGATQFNLLGWGQTGWSAGDKSHPPSDAAWQVLAGQGQHRTAHRPTLPSCLQSMMVVKRRVSAMTVKTA